MGSGKSTSCSETIFEIWKWVDEHNILVTASHITVKNCVEVNNESRQENYGHGIYPKYIYF